MADITSSSSDDGSASLRSRRNDNRLSADRGVISREAWMAASEGDSESESSSETEDDDDSVVLAQRDEADDSGEETEDEEFHMKQELRDAVGDRSAVRVKTEIVDDTDSSSDESEDDKETEGDEISVKSEHGQAIGNGANVTHSPRRVAHSSEESESEAEEMKSEEEDGRNAVTREYASPTELVGPREDEAHSNEEAMARSREADIPTDHLAAVERGEEDEPEQEVDESDIPTRRDMEAARQVIDRFYQSHLSFTEQSELHKGKRIAGPPIDRSISQADQWKRKYRWPVAMRNVRRRRFIADAEEIATDHEVQLVDRPHAASNVSAAVRKAFAAALAPTARPLMTAAVASFREQHEKREREIRFVERLEEAKDGESVSDAVDATRLRALTRLGGQFTDHVLESLLVKNVLALQGVDASYAQQCWDPLPTSKRPVANWRFVLEHFCRTSTHGVDAMPSSSVPRLRKDTLIRIRDRLKNLYGVAWRPEDSAFFDLVDQQELDPPEASEVYRL